MKLTVHVAQHLVFAGNHGNGSPAVLEAKLIDMYLNCQAPGLHDG